MSTFLVKDIVTSIIPGSPEVPAYPGSPYIPGHYETVLSVIVSVSYSNYTLFNNLIGAGGSGEALSPNDSAVPIYTHTSKYIDVWVPAQAVIPGFAGLPAIPSQLSRSLNIGWNTSSVSISQLIIGDYITYNLNPGISGSFVGVGGVGISGQHIDRFEHGIIADQTGISVFENGQVIKTLSSIYDIDTELRIYRQADGRIVYVFISGTDVEVHETTSIPIPSIIPLYVYALLYTGGDIILNSSFETGTVQFGSA